MTNWQYEGDVSLKYGGTFFDLSEWRWGYVSAVRVTDLDSACGQEGCVLIEHLVVLVGKDFSKEKTRVESALSCCGWEAKDILQCRGHESKKMLLAAAFLSYGHYDPDDSWDNYRSFHTEVVAQRDYTDMNVGERGHAGFAVNKVLRRGARLENYVKRNHLS